MSTNAVTRELFDLRDRAEAVGWPVELVKDGWVITAPDGTRLTVHRTVSNTDAAKRARADFRAAGLYRAEQSHRMQEAAKRKRKLEADRAANDARTKAVQARAIALAGGAYASDHIQPEELLRPHATMAAFRVTMTPVLAAVILDRNGAIRRLRETRVRFWAAEIAAGRWQVTHQGIALDTDGVLLDGQHRLAGIIAAAQAVEMMVTVGADRSTFSVIDTGAVRSVGDVLAGAGVTGSGTPSIGALVRLLLAYDQGAALERRRYGNDQLVHAAEQAGPDKLADAYDAARRLKRGASIPYASGGVLAYLLVNRQPDTDLAASYLDGIMSGVDLHSLDPRLAIYRYFTVSRRGLKRTAPEDLAVLLKGWRFHATNRAVQMVAFRKGEAMPTLYQPGSERDEGTGGRA